MQDLNFTHDIRNGVISLTFTFDRKPLDPFEVNINYFKNNSINNKHLFIDHLTNNITMDLYFLKTEQGFYKNVDLLLVKHDFMNIKSAIKNLIKPVLLFL